MGSSIMSFMPIGSCAHRGLVLAALLRLLGASTAAGTCHAGSCTQRASSDGGPADYDVAVHLWEWSWHDIAFECQKYLGPAGYKAVQVSPPQEDVLGNEWWTRYQPVSYKLHSRSGTEVEFGRMVEACRAAGVDVIADVVLNHMTNAPAGSRGRAGRAVASKCSYPGLYNCSHFHNFCAAPPCECSSCANCRVEGCGAGSGSPDDPDNLVNCNLASSAADTGLADLATGLAHVQGALAGYLRRLSELGVAGIRVDAAKHIRPDDLRAVLARCNCSLYANLEVPVGGCGDRCVDVARYEDLGRLWEFKFQDLVFDALVRRQALDTFYQSVGGNSTWPDGASCPGRRLWARSRRAVSFVTNHDTFRHADRSVWLTPSVARYRFANLLMLAHPYGQPVVFSSVNYRSLADQRAPVQATPECMAAGDCELVRVYNASGQEEGGGCGTPDSDAPYVCEHRWPEIAAMVAWRRAAGSSGFTEGGYQLLAGGQAVAMTRGEGTRGLAFLLGSIAPGSNATSALPASVDTCGIAPGTYCNVLAAAGAAGEGGSCWPCSAGCSSRVVVGADGRVTLAQQLQQYEVLAIITDQGAVPRPFRDEEALGAQFNVQ